MLCATTRRARLAANGRPRRHPTRYSPSAYTVDGRRRMAWGEWWDPDRRSQPASAPHCSAAQRIARNARRRPAGVRPPHAAPNVIPLLLLCHGVVFPSRLRRLVVVVMARHASNCGESAHQRASSTRPSTQVLSAAAPDYGPNHATMRAVGNRTGPLGPLLLD